MWSTQFYNYHAEETARRHQESEDVCSTGKTRLISFIQAAYARDKATACQTFDPAVKCPLVAMEPTKRTIRHNTRPHFTYTWSLYCLCHDFTVSSCVVIGCPSFLKKHHRAERNVPMSPEPLSWSGMSGSGALDHHPETCALVNARYCGTFHIIFNYHSHYHF